MPRPFDALRSPEPSSSPSSPDEACNPQRLKLIAKFLSATLLVAVLGKSLAIAAPVIQKKASPESAGMSGEPMRILIERFTADRNSVSAVYTDQLSPATIARVTALDRDARQQLEQIKFDALDQEGKVDYPLSQGMSEQQLVDFAFLIESIELDLFELLAGIAIKGGHARDRRRRELVGVNRRHGIAICCEAFDEDAHGFARHPCTFGASLLLNDRGSDGQRFAEYGH